jgi:hypothetical protein
MKMRKTILNPFLFGLFIIIGCSDVTKMQANNYYVSSAGRKAEFDNLYGKYLGDKIFDVNSINLIPGIPSGFTARLQMRS